MSRFSDDTAVEPVGDGHYTASMDRSWWIVTGPNGGYIAAVVVRAIEAEAAGDGKRLHSLTLHYLRSPAEGPVVIDVVVERRGRSVSTVTARLYQDDVLMVIAIAAVASRRESHEFDDVEAPAAPDPDELDMTVRPADAPPPIPLIANLETRPCLGAALDAPSGPPATPGPAVTGGWLRLVDPTPLDTAALVAFTDFWYPPIFHRLSPEQVAVPTIDLTVHVRRLPVDPLDWVLVRFTSPLAVGGYLVEDGELWDRAGNLLAVSRQLAVIV